VGTGVPGGGPGGAGVWGGAAEGCPGGVSPAMIGLVRTSPEVSCRTTLLSYRASMSSGSGTSPKENARSSGARMISAIFAYIASTYFPVILR
jgi:hypothetical protein